MKTKLSSVLLASLVGAACLTGCGDEAPATMPQISGYDTNSQIQMPQQAAQNQQVPAYDMLDAQAPVVKPAATTKTPAKTTAKTTTTKTTTATKPAATTTTTAGSALANSNMSPAQKIILKTKQTYDGLKSYSATFTMFSKRNDKTVPGGQPILTAETKYIFQAPRNEVFNVVKHSISMVSGAKMIWKGGETAKVKAGGVLGLFPLDLSLNDSKMTTNRNWRFDNLDHVGILSRALDKKATLTLAGKSTINGKEAYMVRVKGTGLDPEVTEENIAIDTKTFTIIADEMYSGTELVFQTKINIDGMNIQVAADAFEL